jgi:hypothetical protein
VLAEQFAGGVWNTTEEGTFAMKRLPLAVLVFSLSSGFAAAEEKISATLYKKPGCQCCETYADYLRENGFTVTVLERRRQSGDTPQSTVPKALEGCHSTVIGSYVVEGHVPVASIRKLLAEKPDIKGISLPGMPQGSPGMSGAKQGPFEVLAITGKPGPAPVFAKE